MGYTPRDLVGTLGRFRTTSVLAPLLILLIILGVLALIATPFAGVDHPLTWMLWIAVMFVVGVILLSYAIWSVINPDRLQTEEYQLEQQRILITDERHPGTMLIDHASLTSNTAITTK
jgi:membrane protein implicated in regulation of membrane protease activity